MKRRGNGEGTVEKVGSHNYKAIAVVGWKDKKHPIRRTKAGFRTAREAREYIPVLKGEKAEKRCLADYWTTIEQEISNMDSSTVRKYRLAYERSCTLAYQPIETIRIEQLNALVNDLTHSSAVAIKNLLSRAYKLAMAEQVCSSNLALLMTIPKESAHVEKMPFAKGEIDILHKGFEKEKDVRKKRILGCCLLQIYTGMMTGEICSCKVEHCDMETRTINGVGMKTEKRRTTPIVVPSVTLPILEWLCSNSRNGRLLPLTDKNYRINFKNAMARLGLPPHTPYDCRHTTATMLQNRLEPNALTEVMRHSDLTMTQHYKHRKTEELLDLVDKAWK